MAFLINEDEALKNLLKGLTVSDQNATRDVKVYFRLPEAEERQITYPFLTIDLLDIEEERDRAHTGRIKLAYVPDGYSASPAGSDNKADMPIPVSLMYQITSYCRSAWHDRQLTAQLLGNRLPFRYGSLYVEADDTDRRLDFIDLQQIDGLDANSKRVFRKAYTVAVSAEIFPTGLVAVQQVLTRRISVFHQLEPFVVESEGA